MEFSDLSKIVFYLISVVALNILLICLNSIANALVDIERQSYSLNVMKQLGAELSSIIQYTFNKVILVYIISALLGCVFGYMAMSRGVVDIVGVDFGIVHFIISIVSVTLLSLLIISIIVMITYQKYLKTQ